MSGWDPRRDRPAVRLGRISALPTRDSTNDVECRTCGEPVKYITTDGDGDLVGFDPDGSWHRHKGARL